MIIKYTQSVHHDGCIRPVSRNQYENKHEFLHVFNMIHIHLCVSAAGVCVYSQQCQRELTDY